MVQREEHLAVAEAGLKLVEGRIESYLTAGRSLLERVAHRLGTWVDQP